MTVNESAFRVYYSLNGRLMFEPLIEPLWKLTMKKINPTQAENLISVCFH